MSIMPNHSIKVKVKDRKYEEVKCPICKKGTIELNHIGKMECTNQLCPTNKLKESE